MPPKMASPDNTKPTILLSTGAWHPPHLYHPLKDALAKRGYTLLAPAHPTMSKDARDLGWDVDTKSLLDAAEPLFAEGKQVILVAHSYGGIPATVATRGNGVAERKGPGGFKHIVFLAAFALPIAGRSLLAMLPEAQWLPWHKLLVDSEGQKIEQMFIHKELARPLLYNDLSEERADEFLDALVPQSYGAFIQPISFGVGEVTIPKTYIVCEQDAAFPVALQEELASSFGFKRRAVSGGHSAFASVPDELAEVLIRIAEEVD